MATSTVTKITVSATEVRLRSSISVVDPVVSVSRTIPIADISYIHLILTAGLDTSGRFRYIEDLIAVSDGFNFVLSRPFADSIQISDGITSKVFDKSLAEVVVMLDELTAIIVFIRAFSDTQNISEQYVSSFFKSLSDSVNAQDALAKTVTKSFADGFAMNDSAEATDGLLISFSTAIQNVAFLSDAKYLSPLKFFNESVSASDSGFILQQDYIDLTYFAEDYVGIGYTF
jgi:hypothetical protein